MPLTDPTRNHDEIRQWATRHRALPVELLPHRVDGEPALLRLKPADQTRDRKDVKLLSWEEFFAKFDSLGLAFIYDDEDAGYNEILDVEGSSAYRHPEHRPERFTN